MRHITPTAVLIAVSAVSGCASVHLHPKTGMEVNYTGPARGAAQIVYATDGRSYKLAETAMEHGMSAGLARDAYGGVRFSAGGYGLPYGYNTGYAAYGGTDVYVPGVGLVPIPPNVGLPPLLQQPAYSPSAQSPTPSSSGLEIVPCPRDRPPATVPEQAACAELTARTAFEQATDSN